MSTDLA
jgi:hypothetical protein